VEVDPEDVLHLEQEAEAAEEKHEEQASADMHWTI
jgi:hypothetical protein